MIGEEDRAESLPAFIPELSRVCVAKECGGREAMGLADSEDVPHKGAGHQPPHFRSKEGRERSQRLPM